MPITGSAPKHDAQSLHFLTFPFALTERRDGGLPAVILNEVRRCQDKQVTMFTKDPVAHENWEGVRIVPADMGGVNGELFDLWFGNGFWPVLFPKAHTFDATTPAAIRAMYAPELVEQLTEEMVRMGGARAAVPEVGSHEFAVRFSDRFAPAGSVNEKFNQTFYPAITEELTRAASQNQQVRFHFQDYFFHNTAERFGQQIRDAGGLVTYHLHTSIPSIPESVPLSRLIVDLARAVSVCDVVLTHTPEYNVRLRRILERLGLPHPEYRTFALGIDEQDLAARETRITPENFQTAIPNLSQMTPRQQLLVRQALSAEAEGIPHQFGVFDRLDPVKGLDTVFTAVGDFLDEESKTSSLEELRAKYRFFCLLQLLPNSPKEQGTNMAVNYVHHVAEIGRRLEEKWPGIFLMAEGLTGGQRDLIVALMRGRTTITGGAEDGLNLVIMESSFINRDRPTGLIAGENIGFVMDNPTHRASEDFLTFRPGSISELVQKMRQVVKLQEQNPGRLVEAKQALNVSIARRDASMLLDE